MYSYLFDAVNLSRLCAEGFGELSVLLLDTAGHIGLFIQQFLLQRPVGEGENLRGEEGGGGQAAMKAAELLGRRMGLFSESVERPEAPVIVDDVPGGEEGDG